ncbi:MAG: hypothetical protein QM346_10840 [Chloroflexota bacterium]|nr:hypothetical protein [Chloroflexota bacterium]
MSDGRFGRGWRLGWLIAAGALYVALAAYQLGLPGLHYDEAKEAGINALELLNGMPVTAFRGATLDVAGLRLPLMVQDYIGALNVYLALPFLALSGVGVPNLRILPVLTGLAGLFLVERAVSEWVARGRSERTSEGRRLATQISLGGLAAVTLLAASPSYVFWSRQGIFVTNLMQPLCSLMIWQGLRWLRTGRRDALMLAAFAAGLALYAKLLAVWVIAPFALLAAGWWAARRMKGDPAAPPLSAGTVVAAALAFVLPLLPLALFNVQSGGTLSSVLQNAGRSYYGVNNLAIVDNLGVRLSQLVQVLRGDQFWYLGGSYANAIAPWLALAALAAGILLAPRRTLPPAGLLAVGVLLSVFTISDMFVTHYALLQPLAIAAVAVALDVMWQAARPSLKNGRAWRGAVVLAVALWLALDLSATLRYHGALSRSGGLSDHSDASYHLAYFLRHNGMGAPLALDWGIDAPVRFLSQGAVTPIELFGYASPEQPDADYATRLGQFLPNPDNVYLLHAPGRTVFAGRREAFMAEAEAHGLSLRRIEQFTQRDGEPLFEVWRAMPPE